METRRYIITSDRYGDSVPVTLHEVEQQIKNWSSEGQELGGLYVAEINDQIVELDHNDAQHRIVIAQLEA